MVFMFAYTFGIGPAGDIYISEITCNKSSAVAISIGWLVATAVAITSPHFLYSDYIQYLIIVVNFGSLVTIPFIVKETWGKALNDTR